MNRRVAVRAIIIDNGKLLAVRLKPYGGTGAGIASDQWCTVGGGVDAGEPLIPALEREVLEETGIMPKVGNLLFVQQFLHKETEQMEFFFHVSNTEDFKNIDLAKTSHGVEEIAEIDFIATAESKLLPKFLTHIDFNNFNTTIPTQFFNYITKEK